MVTAPNMPSTQSSKGMCPEPAKLFHAFHVHSRKEIMIIWNAVNMNQPGL